MAGLAKRLRFWRSGTIRWRQPESSGRTLGKPIASLERSESETTLILIAFKPTTIAVGRRARWSAVRSATPNIVVFELNQDSCPVPTRKPMR